MDIKLNPQPRRRGSALLATTAGCLLAGSLALPGLAMAQASVPDPVPEDLESLDDIDLAPSSVEQGQTPMDQSFGPSREQWIRDTRRQAFEDTKFDVQLRTYYLDRDKYDDSRMASWALGGSAGFKTGYFREFFSLGATAYTSQKLYGPEDKDGAGLLAPGQEGYGKVGEVYGEFLLNQDTRLTLGRRAFDTPYINKNDARMTPNTFQAAVLQGLYGDSKDRGEWRVGAGYFDKIKERTSESFVSMARDAGAPAGVDRGVYSLGANYTLGDLSVGAIGYYSNDIIGIFYTEAKYTFALSDDWKLRAGLQYSDQSSNGDQLLRGASFDSNQWGAKAELVRGGALFTLAYTDAGGGTNMQNPWSGYPGYTSVQVEDFNRDGESAWMARAGYDFPSIKGLGVYALYVDGSDPSSPTEYSRKEADFNVQWKATEGMLKGLMVRLRYAQVSQDAPFTDDLKDLRVMVYYDPPSL